VSEDEPTAPGDLEARPGDRFYRGMVLKVNHGRGTGIIRTGNGREVRFELPFVDFLDERRIRDLEEGMVVGFDVGWTSRGLRVTQIKID
jgi:cold shock CspA family protein